MSADDIRLVFDAWASGQKRPNLCRFNADRKEMIRKRMSRGYSAADLIALMRYAYESDSQECRFWRGEDGGRSYIGLDNLLRVTKLADRIERALGWLEDLDGREHDVGLNDDEEDGVVLDFVGELRRRGRS